MVNTEIADCQAAFDSVPYPLVLLDADARIVRANRAGVALLSAAAISIGEQCSSILRSQANGAESSSILAALKSKQIKAMEIYDAQAQRWMLEVVNPILDEAQNVNGAVLSVEDITERKTQQESLRQALAEVDKLKERLRAETDYLRADFKIAHPQKAILGQSEAVRKALHQVEQVAPTDANVLLCGETGTGKELFAEALHSLSSRKDRHIVKVNCAALPQPLVESELFGREKGAYTGALARQEGRFELADNSSIFLDEIGELSLEIQAKLLRVLQEGQFERLGSPRTMKVNVRLIAATNRDLADEVRKGRFRQDLYYRFNVLSLTMPPLRQRSEDIQLLATHFAKVYSTKCKRRIEGISPEARSLLRTYDWPGNVRELENAIERAVVLGGVEMIVPEDLPESLFETRESAGALTVTYQEALKRAKSAIVVNAIKETNGNYIEAARKLGLHPNNLHRLIRNLDLKSKLRI